MDFLKNAISLGVGMASLTKDKANKLADDLIKRGELTKKEKKKLVEKLIGHAKKQEKDLIKKINKNIQTILTDMGMPTKKELNRISKRLDALEKKKAPAKKK